MAFHCPHCQAVVLSRRNKLCGFCQEPLPVEIVLTPAQIAAIEAEEQERETARKLRDEERAKAAAKARLTDSGGGGFAGFGG